MSRKNIVVVGGGTGNRTTLTGLKNQKCNLSAVVAMTDSGVAPADSERSWASSPTAISANA